MNKHGCRLWISSRIIVPGLPQRNVGRFWNTHWSFQNQSLDLNSDKNSIVELPMCENITETIRENLTCLSSEFRVHYLTSNLTTQLHSKSLHLVRIERFHQGIKNCVKCQIIKTSFLFLLLHKEKWKSLLSLSTSQALPRNHSLEEKLIGNVLSTECVDRQTTS